MSNNYQPVTERYLLRLLNLAAPKLKDSGIHILEKDFWLCLILEYLFTESPWKEQLSFKGGTSLSKCFNVIHRFSEDIDLILDWRALGYGLTTPWEERSRSQQIKLNKEIGLKTQAYLAETFAPTLAEALSLRTTIPHHVEVEEESIQTVTVTYEPLTQGHGYVVPTVRLEIGPLAAWTPCETVYISRDLDAVLDEDLRKKIPITTVRPDRTFWEKASILHDEANRPETSSMPQRYSRHYYDLFRLSQSIYKQQAFENVYLLEKVMAFKEKFYPRGWAKYHEATLKGIRLIPDRYRFEAIKADYAAMQSEMFAGVTPPSFEEVMEGIAALEAEIHAL